MPLNKMATAVAPPPSAAPANEREAREFARAWCDFVGRSSAGDTASNMTKKKRENLCVAQEVRGEVRFGPCGCSPCSPGRGSPRRLRGGPEGGSGATWLWERRRGVRALRGGNPGPGMSGSRAPQKTKHRRYSRGRDSDMQGRPVIQKSPKKDQWVLSVLGTWSRGDCGART